MLQLKAVVLPTTDGEEQVILERARQAVSGVGTFHEQRVVPYDKVAGSRMVSAMASFDGEAAPSLAQVVEAAGGTAWVMDGDGDELDAIWHEGDTPPLGTGVFWAHAQVFPVSAMPPHRRPKGAP